VNELGEWHVMGVDEVMRQVGTDLASGLSTETVSLRLNSFGYNELAEAKKRSPLRMFLEQFKEFLVLILLGAAAVSAVVGELEDAIVILVIVILNGILGFIQEYKAEKSLSALKKLAAPTARVVRKGQVAEVAARELVPGDVILVEAGSLVPADARLVSAAALRVDESALTGESIPVEKSIEKLAEEAVGIGDRKNMIFMGTVVTYGNARAIVVETGMRTEIGKIASALETVPQEQTPLQRRLEQAGKVLGGIAIGLCIVIFLVGVFRGEQPFEMFMTAISLAVAAVPEGLPAIVTIVLALGVQRMAKRQAIIRKLPAVETLGSATVICSDKTGTLTQNEMTVRRIYAGDRLFHLTGEGYRPEGEFLYGERQVEPLNDEHISLLLTIGSLNNNARLRQVAEAGRAADESKRQKSWDIIGDPTEGALLVAAMKAGLKQEELADEFPRLAEIPFDSERKLMTTVHPALKHSILMDGKEYISFTKGAPDVLLERCTRIYAEGKLERLTKERKEKLLHINTSLASQAFRVLGLAFRELDSVPGDPDLNMLERELVFVGFMAMADPPRPEAKKAVSLCKTAGIKPVMITGDHKLTATAIARELGIFKEGDLALTGVELDAMSEEEFGRQVEEVSIYARVSPEHKVRIVDALKGKGHVVAMTGDGVNDAPALRRADIGAAMGMTGTDVAKEAADMVLADDNFATIVAAVREGRVIYDNIRKAIHFLLSCNSGELIAMFLAIIGGMPLPLIPIQILWVNLVTDGLPALALGVERPERDIMERPPRKTKEGIFSERMGLTILIQGLFIGVITLSAFWLGYRGQTELLGRGRTMGFATLAFSQIARSFNARSVNQSLLRLGLTSNRYLIAAAIVSGMLQASVMMIPVLQGIFETVPLNRADWLVILGLSISPIIFVELTKAFSRSARQRE